MLSAVRFFSEEERKRIARTVAEAEKCTSGQILPVVATASDEYERAEDLVGLWAAVAGLGFQWWLMLPSARIGEWNPIEAKVSWVELLMMLGVVIGCFLIGAAVASRIGWLRRLFTSRSHMRRCVEHAAARVFYEQGLHSARRRIGILIYISLFERMVRVTGDQAISERLSKKDWKQVVDLILKELRKGKGADAMIAGIRRCGEILTKYVPIQRGDLKELSNELIVLS